MERNTITEVRFIRRPVIELAETRPRREPDKADPDVA